MLKVYINNNKVDYINAEVQRSIESFCGSFSVELRQDVDCKKNDNVVIYSNNEKIITAKIENITDNVDKSTYSLSISGRDKTGELIDSHMKPKIYKQKTFKSLVQAVLKDNGYNFKIIEDVITSRLIDKTEDGGHNKIFDFLDEYAKKAQVLLFTDEDGDLVITREGSDLAVNVLDSNNILQSTLDTNINESYKFIDVYGSIKNNYSTKRNLQKASIVNNLSNTNKRLIVKVSNNSSYKTLNLMANWYKNVKQATGSKYECSVKEHSQGGLLWKPNSVVNIIDNRKSINGVFLIQGVKYRSGASGNITDLSIVNLGSFGLPPANNLLSKLIRAGSDLSRRFN